MKTKHATQHRAAVLGAVALTLLLIPNAVNAGGRRGHMPNSGMGNRGSSMSGINNSNRGQHGRGGANDRRNHDANDDRGVHRNGADDGANHDANDDNNRNRGGRGR